MTIDHSVRDCEPAMATARELTKIWPGCRLRPSRGSQPCNPIRAERDLYNGLTQAEPTLPSLGLLGRRRLPARPRRHLVQKLAAGLPRGRPCPAAGIQDLPRRHAGNRRAARRHRRTARLPQHLPASRFAALPGERGPAEGAADHLPLPRLVLFAARRSRARAVEVAARGLRQGRPSALPRGAVGMARLRLRQSGRRTRPARRRHPSIRHPATSPTGRWKRWSSAMCCAR